MRGTLRPRFLGIDGVLISMDHEIVDPIFDVSRCVGLPKNALVVRLVFCEQQRGISITVEITFAQFAV